MRKLLLTTSFALVGAASCAVEQGTVFIEGVLSFDDDCSVSAADNVFQATSLLDIGFNAATANNLVLPLKVRTNLPSTFSTQDLSQDQTSSPNFPAYGATDNNVITFTESEVFFSTDADQGGELALINAGTPVNANTARLTGVSGVAFNEQTQLLSESAVFVTAITQEDAALLQAEQFIAEALNADNPNGPEANTVRVIANVRLLGATTGSAEVRSPPFPFPVELCRGCLIPEACPAGQIAVPLPGACVRGQDVPFVCQ